MDSILHDLQQSMRILTRRPKTAVIAIVLLALGIGVCTTIFSIVNGVLLSPLPYPGEDRLVSLWETHAKQPANLRVASAAIAETWRKNLAELDGLAISQPWQPVLAQAEDLSSVQGARVSDSFFSVLGIQPVLGRDFDRTDVQAGAAPVVILSHEIWTRHYGGDRALLGKTITVEGRGTTSHPMVIGVLPPGVSISEPATYGECEIFSPLIFDAAAIRLGQRYYRVIGRLHAAQALSGLRARLDQLSTELAQTDPLAQEGWRANVETFSEQIKAPVRPALWTLLAAACGLFLVACCNVGILLLARASRRQQELAVRQALGASPAQVGRQLLTESLLMVLASGGLGLLLAWSSLSWIVVHVFEGLPRQSLVAIDERVVGFVLLLSFATFLLFGLLPASSTFRSKTWSSLLAMGRTSASGDSRGVRFRKVLVLAETALSLVLLIAAMLMLRSFDQLTRTQLGFEARGIVTMRLQVPQSLHPSPAQRALLYSQVAEEVGALPSIDQTSLVNHLPMQGSAMSTSASSRESRDDRHRVDLRGVGPNYFHTMGITLLSGRDLRSEELRSGRAAIISRSAADRLWPGESAIGRQLVVDWSHREPQTVVGIVEDVRHHGIRASAQPTVYLPFTQLPHRSLMLVARSREPITAISDLHRIAREPKGLVADRIEPLTSVVSAAIAEPRGRTWLTTAFAAITLLLAISGTYSVVSYDVAQKKYDIGIRQALGARPRQLLHRALAEGMRHTGLGLGLGLLLSAIVTRALAGLLFGVSEHDPWVWLGATFVMGTIAVIASYVPTRRALRLNPARILRES